MLLLDYQNVLIESLLKDRFNGYVMRKSQASTAYLTLY